MPVQSKQIAQGNWISNVDWFKFVIRVTGSEDNSPVCYFDIPGQEAWDIPVDMFLSDSSIVKFDIYNRKNDT